MANSKRKSDVEHNLSTEIRDLEEKIKCLQAQKDKLNKRDESKIDEAKEAIFKFFSEVQEEFSKTLEKKLDDYQLSIPFGGFIVHLDFNNESLPQDLYNVLEGLSFDDLNAFYTMSAFITFYLKDCHDNISEIMLISEIEGNTASVAAKTKKVIDHLLLVYNNINSEDENGSLLKDEEFCSCVRQEMENSPVFTEYMTFCVNKIGEYTRLINSQSLDKENREEVISDTLSTFIEAITVQ